MTDYPLVIRNRMPLFFRGFMLVFLAMTAVITFVAIRDRPPTGAGPFLFYILLLFWAVGLGALFYGLNSEVAVVRVTNPGSIHIERGKAFRRVEHWADHARLWIEDTKDSESDPYFKLWMDAPGGPLTISEGHSRAHIEELQLKVEKAIRGR